MRNGVLVLWLALVLAVPSTTEAGTLESQTVESPVTPGYQAAYHYQGNSADDFEAYGEFDELQGIANGDPALGHPFWYFSRNKGAPDLFQVSYDQHLNTSFNTDPKTIFLPPTTCDHVGDIDYYAYGTDGYILAAFNDCDDGKAYIGIFRADDLSGAGIIVNAHAYFNVAGHQGNQAPWVTVTQDGAIWSGTGKIDPKHVVFKYSPSWPHIGQGGEIAEENLEPEHIELFYPDGTPFIKQHWQGADFSSDGEYFYFVEGFTGYGYIHSFRVGTGNAWYRERVSKDCSSCSPNCADCMPFLFMSSALANEPQGISYFDMNDVTSYHSSMPRGELHAVVLNNWGTDSVYIKHYTSIIDVVPQDSIYETFYQAWGEGAWDGSILRIQAGSFDEQGSLVGRKVKFVSEGGTSRIGSQ